MQNESLLVLVPSDIEGARSLPTQLPSTICPASSDRPDILDLERFNVNSQDYRVWNHRAGIFDMLDKSEA